MKEVAGRLKNPRKGRDRGKAKTNKNERKIGRVKR